MSEPITFERGGVGTVRLAVVESEGEDWIDTDDATPEDIAAVLEAHPEIAEAAGWVRKETACKEAENAIRGYRLQNTLDLMDDGPLDIVDALTPPGETDVSLGRTRWLMLFGALSCTHQPKGANGMRWTAVPTLGAVEPAGNRSAMTMPKPKETDQYTRMATAEETKEAER